MKTKCPQVALLEFRCRNKNFSTSIIVPFLLKLCSPHIKNCVLGCTCFYCKLIIHWHMVIIMYGRNNHPLFFSSAVGLSTSFSLYHVFNFFCLQYDLHISYERTNGHTSRRVAGRGRMSISLLQAHRYLFRILFSMEMVHFFCVVQLRF